MAASFDVFLSHNSKDKSAVRELAKALSARGLKVWLDEWELVPGRPWQEALEEIIQTTRASVVLVGKDGLGPWEQEEMRGCLSEFVDRKLPVIPVLLPGASEKPKLPFFLKRLTWVDLRKGLTEEGLDRLEWGITGKRRHSAKPKGPAPEPIEAPVITAYCEWATEQYRGLSLIGVGGGDVRMSFKDVYVPLRIGRRPERLDLEGGKESAGWAEASRELQVEEIFTAPYSADCHALILGHPGSGKTTALRKLLNQCLKDPESLGLARGVVPVFLRLRRLLPEDLEQDHPLLVLLARELAEVGAGKLPSDLGERLWEQGNLLLLLDGLDEIAAEPLRVRVCQALDWELNGRVRAVVSCRFAGYGNRVRLGESFLPLEVRPLNADQCRRLVRLWFREAPRAVPDFPEAEARRAAERLITALDGPGFGTQQWKVLISSPLLLTLLCVIVLRGGQMPRQRVAFYDECLRVMLGRWSRARQGELETSVEPPLDVETALAILRSLAWNLHVSGRRDDLSRLDAVDRIEQRLVTLGKAPVGFQVLDWLHREAGILIEAAPREYGFLHLGLQEYLTALEIASRGEELLDEVAACWNAEWWQEVLLLLVGLPGRRLFAPLLQRLLASPALLEREDLLRTCLEEALEVDLGPFLERLGSSEPPDRQAAVLRLLLGRTDPQLLTRVTELKASTDPSVAALAERLLAVEPSGSWAPSTPGAIDLLLLHHPSDRADALALANLLRRAGLHVSLGGEGSLEDELFEETRGVAVLWGPSGQPPWEDEALQTCLRIFSRRGTAKLALQLPPSSEPPVLPPEWQGTPWIDLGPALSVACISWIRQELSGRDFDTALQESRQFVPGQGFIEPLTGIHFLWIPGGRFRMGGNKLSTEQPVHWVQVSPFWLGETPVTNRQFAVFLEKTSAHEPHYWRDRRFSSPDQPVVGVSWEEAAAFCQWLSEASGQKILLPSEAQWEFAARGSDGREYPWGNAWPAETRMACFGLDPEKGQPAPVGSCPAGRGPFGTLDQAGNVWEWCRDIWDEKAYANRVQAGEPTDPFVQKLPEGKKERRVLRGGGCFSFPVALRAACRCGYPARVREVDNGFRVVAASPRRLVQA